MFPTFIKILDYKPVVKVYYLALNYFLGRSCRQCLKTS